MEFIENGYWQILKFKDNIINSSKVGRTSTDLGRTGGGWGGGRWAKMSATMFSRQRKNLKSPEKVSRNEISDLLATYLAISKPTKTSLILQYSFAPKASLILEVSTHSTL